MNKIHLCIAEWQCKDDFYKINVTFAVALQTDLLLL